jgi:hypothetical protein
VKEGGKEVVPPVTLKHCSNFYYEGSKAYEGRYSVPSKVPSKVFHYPARESQKRASAVG